MQEENSEIKGEKGHCRIIFREIPFKGKGYAYADRAGGHYEKIAAQAAEQLIRSGAKKVYFACKDKAAAIPEDGFETGAGVFRFDNRMDEMECRLPAHGGPVERAALSVHSLTEESSERYCEIYNKCFFYVPNSATYQEEDRKRLLAGDGNSQAFLAEWKNKTVGFYELSQKENIPEIASIGILSEYRGNGFGKSLLYFVMDQLAGEGFSRVSLQVSTANPVAYHLYCGAGFVKMRVLSRWYRLDAADAAVEKR